MAHNPFSDWRAVVQATLKQASSTPDGKTVERAFADQAYQFIQSRAGPLLQDPYRLGFEIVYRNEPDNNRLIGVFGFRVSDTLLLAPVFFLNGQIKGQDLLYRSNLKMFIPFTKGWVDKILAQATSVEGRSVPHAPHLPSSSIGLDKLTGGGSSRGWTTKMASEAFSEMMEQADKIAMKHARGDALVDFLKKAGAGSLDLLASWMERSPEFADTLHREGLLQSIHKQADEIVKSAAIKTEPMVQYFSGPVTEATPEALRKLQNTEGYAISDKRDLAELSTIFDDLGSMRSITAVNTEAGVHRILFNDGSLRVCAVAPVCEDAFRGSRDSGLCESGSHSHEWSIDIYRARSRNGEIVVVDVEDGSEMRARSDTDALTLLTENPTNPESIGTYLKDNPAPGFYRVWFGETKRLSPVIYVKSTETKNGLLHVTICERYYGTAAEFAESGNTKTLVVNRSIGGDILDKDSASQTFYLGDSVSFLPSAREEGDAKPLGASRGIAILNFNDLFRSPLRKVTLRKQAGCELYRLEASNFGGSVETSRWLGKTACVAHMLVKLAMPADAVVDLVKSASKSPTFSASRTLLVPETLAKQSTSSLVKFGSFILPGEPAEEVSMDPEFGVQWDVPYHAMLQAKRDLPPFPGGRWGDALTHKPVPPEGLNLLAMNPEQIEQEADTRQLPSVFEHGVIGAMVDTYDSISMVNSFLPGMLDVLDKLGRMLFLIHWKPQDFVKAFGRDDIEQLEAQVLNQFRSFGDLVLKLQEKSEADIGGSNTRA